MATVNDSRRYAVDRAAAFAYLTDPKAWPDFYSGVVSVDDPETATFANPGDTVGITYSLLGRRLHGSTTVEEIEPGSRIRHTSKVQGIPEVTETWEYRDADGGLELEVTLTTEEATSFLGKTIDRVVIPRTLQHDVERTLDRIDEIFSVGIPQS